MKITIEIKSTVTIGMPAFLWNKSSPTYRGGMMEIHAHESFGNLPAVRAVFNSGLEEMP